MAHMVVFNERITACWMDWDRRVVGVGWENFQQSTTLEFKVGTCEPIDVPFSDGPHQRPDDHVPFACVPQSLTTKELLSNAKQGTTILFFVSVAQPGGKIPFNQ